MSPAPEDGRTRGEAIVRGGARREIWTAYCVDLETIVQPARSDSDEPTVDRYLGAGEKRMVTGPPQFASPLASTGSRSANPRRAGIDDAAVALALFITLVVSSSIHYFPYQDSTNNLTRYVLMERAWFGTPAPFVSVRLIPTPYIALDLLGVALVHTLGPPAALRAMACILISIIPTGLYALLRATCPERRGWAIVGVLCGVGFYLMIGFFNFVAGTGAALFWLAAWWPRRDTVSWRSRTGLMLGLVVVFLIHLAGVMTVLVVLGVAYVVGLRDRRTNRQGRPASPVRDLWIPELVNFVLATAAVGVMFLIWRRSLGSEPRAAGVPPVFRSPFNKVANLGSPFYALGFVQMAVMGTGYAASLLTFLAINRRTLRLDPMIASAIAFVAIFMVFPYAIDGAGYVDMRWLLPAILLPFCATAARPVPSQRTALAVPFFATIAHMAILRGQAAQIDAQLTVYHRVLELVPPHARLLPLVTTPAYHWRASPYRHFALWHTIEGGGQVPGLLSEEDRYDTNPPSRPHKFFGHFRVPVNVYYPDERWGIQLLSPLDWRRIGSDYDYIVQAGENPEARAMIASHADLVARSGEIALFRVRGAPGAGRP